MKRLVHLRSVLLLITLGMAVLAVPLARRLSFDQTIESFFAPQNPDIRLLQRSRSDFGGDEYVIVAWKQPDLVSRDAGGLPELTETATARINDLAAQLNAVPGVDASKTRHLAQYLENAPRSRNTRSAMLKLFQGMLIGPDQVTTAIILQLQTASEAAIPRGETVAQIRRVASAFDAAAAVAGEPVQIQDMFDLVERDGFVLYLVSLVVLSAVLLLIFRGLRWMLAPIGIVVVSVVCTRAALVLSGVQLSMVSSMLDSLVTVISVATTMHIIVCFREHRNDLSLSAPEAAVKTLRELWLPIFWSMVTTAVGFGSLLVSEIVPVQSFSIMMTVGTGMVLLLTMMLAPAMLVTGSGNSVPGRAPMEARLDRFLSSLAHSIEDHPYVAGSVCLVMMLITAPGLWLMTVETDFSRNFRSSSPIVQSLKFVESNLGGAGTWEVAFDVPEELSVEFLNSTGELTNRLRQLKEEGIQLDVVSLNDAVNLPPRLGTQVARLKRLQGRQSDLADSFYNPEARRMRIVLRSREQQPAEAKMVQIAWVRAIVREHFATMSREAPKSDMPSGDRVEPSSAGSSASGLFVLLAYMIESLLKDQTRSFLVATGGIMICMTVAFRSLRLGLISLLPNIFPVVLVTGALGVLHIPINIGTAMIASVSMGLTVDSTIHYITAFERARKTLTLRESLRVAHGGAGRAVVLAYLALTLGFLVLTVSEFIPLVYFGALLSLSMIGGMVGDLVLLPLLLWWTTPAPETR